MRGWAFFDQLLVAALRGAFALEQMHRVAVMIGQHLHFDVTGAFDVALHVDAGVAEGGLGFDGGLLQSALEGQIVGGHAHAFATTAGRGFDQDGEANFVGQADGFLFVFDQPFAAGHHGHIGGFGQLPGGVFVPQFGHRLRRGADEVDVATAADFVEVGVLRQKTVAGMDGLDVADFGGADDAVDFQITVGGFRRADAICFVGQIEIARTAIGFAEDGHGFDAQFAAGADDPQRNFAPIGHQNAFEHRSD